MKSINLLFLGLTLIIFSCGPSQEEIKKKEKYIADSLRTAKEDSISRAEKQREKARIHQEKIEVGKSIKKTKLTDILSELNTQLIKEQRELSKINQFQLGRSSSEKQKQLNDQNEKIYELETFISKIKKEISMTELFNSFDFQVTPKGTVEHIFSSAKNNDFSKMRHLLDPYGEYDSDALQICLVEVLSKDNQEEWKKLFAKGRIMSEPVINDNKAEVEIAIGHSSDRLEKIELVKRMDKWYILAM